MSNELKIKFTVPSKCSWFLGFWAEDFFTRRVITQTCGLNQTIFAHYSLITLLHNHFHEKKFFFCLCMLLTHTAIKSAALALVAAKTLILQKKVFRFSCGQRHLLTRFFRGPGVMESYPSQILIKNLDSNMWNMYVCIHFKNEFEHKSHRKQTKTTYRILRLSLSTNWKD